MKITKLNKTDGISRSQKHAVCLGLFDGVHIGHRALIEKTCEIAKERNISSAVFTFASEGCLPKSKERLYSTKEKLEIFESLNVDTVFLADFKELADMQPREFTDKILLGEINADVVLTGEDFRFGKNAKGDAAMLKCLLDGRGVDYIPVSDVLLPCGNKISSAHIKELLAKGDVKAASVQLGAPYFLSGEVIKGDGRGKTLGFPTINTDIESNRAPIKSGVYKTEVQIGKRTFKGLTNIGNCPTFGERKIHAETFILDCNENFYGENVKIALIDFLRGEMKFASAEELKMQIKVDINTIKGDI